MVSLVQMEVYRKMVDEGWLGIAFPKGMDSPIGGPAYLGNSSHEIIAIYANGDIFKMVREEKKLTKKEKEALEKSRQADIDDFNSGDWKTVPGHVDSQGWKSS